MASGSKAKKHAPRRPAARSKPKRPAPVARKHPAPKAAPKKAPKPSKPVARPAKKGAAPSAGKSAPAPPPAPAAPPRAGDSRRHVLSLSFLRDGDEFLARLETDGGQITELKNRALDQLLTLVAGELEDLLE